MTSAFYAKYKSLFEEDEMSSNYALRLLGGAGNGTAKYKPVSQNITIETTPERKLPMIPEPAQMYPLQKMSQPKVLRPNLLIEQKKNPTPRLNPLKAEALNALLDYPSQLPRPQPLFPKLPRMPDQEFIPKEVFRAGDPALRNVYKNTLASQSQLRQDYYDFSTKKRKENAAGLKSRGESRLGAMIEQSSVLSAGANARVPLKETYNPEVVTSNVPTSENVFPTPPKKSEKPSEETDEYRQVRIYREARKNRDRARKIIRVILAFSVFEQCIIGA